MCGIIAYIGKKNALPVLLGGLKTLEYRGYDSAGIALAKSDGIFLEKRAGRIHLLEKSVVTNAAHYIKPATCGIAHTRWATHGAPTDANAHPHSDCKNEFFVIHNGIIENYAELRDKLEKLGHVFRSETDTEVIAHLIESQNSAPMPKGRDFGQSVGGGNPFDKLSPSALRPRVNGERRRTIKSQKLEKLVLSVLPILRGTYALAVVSSHEPQKIVVARNFSPLLLGIGRNEYFAASDASAILAHTKKVIYLNDGEIATLSPSGIKIINAKSRRGVTIRKKINTVRWSLEETQKGHWRHFTMKEIMETPLALENAMRGRLVASKNIVKLGGLELVKKQLQKIDKISIVACGSAYCAGKVGEYWLENIAGIDVETDIASEFRYRNPVINPKRHAVLVISQSGETADTLAAVELAKKQKALVLGIVNAVGSSIARATSAGIYQYAGSEIGVATTKAFSSQLAVLMLFSLWLAEHQPAGAWLRQLQKAPALKNTQLLMRELAAIPEKVSVILENHEEIRRIAEKYFRFSNFFVLGRNYNSPIAQEGALKIKEITYSHAEGYAAGEMKHGPLAMVDENFVTIGIAPSTKDLVLGKPSTRSLVLGKPQDNVYEKMLSNLQEIKARKGPILAIATEGDETIRTVADDVIYIPKTLEPLYPMLTVIPLQLFAYYMGVHRGLDVDKPRNLAKSVTVE